MKKLVLLHLLLFIILSLKSQSYLNQRESFGYANSKIQSVLVDKDGYYLTGIMIDSSNLLHGFQSFFMKVDFNGDLIFKTNLTSPDIGFELWGEGTFFTKDSTIIVLGNWLEDYRYGLITEFSKKGELLRRVKIPNPIRVEGHSITLNHLKELPSGNFIFTANPIDSNNFFKFMFGKMNKDFEILWHKTTQEPLDLVTLNVLFEDEANFIIGGYSHNDTDFDFEYKMRLFKADTLGNVIWDFASEVNDSLADCHDMTFDRNGNLIIAGASVLEEKDTFGIDRIWGTAYFKPAVVKFDTTEKKIKWKKTLVEYWSNFEPLVRVLPVQNNSEFVFGGHVKMNHRDSIETDTRGLIFKINQEGDTLWTRTFQFLTERERTHYFNDMEITEDGGIIAGGVSIQTVFTPDDFPVIQTWLVKTDEEGCIVPNCGISPTNTISQNNFILNVYPNPTSEQLIFYLNYHQKIKNISCRLLNINGEELKRYNNLSNDNTYIMSLEGLNAGTYFLQILDGNKISETEKVIVKI